LLRRNGCNADGISACLAQNLDGKLKPRAGTFIGHVDDSSGIFADEIADNLREIARKRGGPNLVSYDCVLRPRLGGSKDFLWKASS
jgi:hypothetical protein